jgi:hypothetical protein
MGRARLCSYAWNSKSNAEKEKIARKRSVSLVKYFDSVGRKPAPVYKRSAEVRARMGAARKRAWAREKSTA